MSWRYDPSVSSHEYLELARRRHRTDRTPRPYGGEGIFSECFDYGVHSNHVTRLLNPRSWNPTLAAEGRRPRVFIDLYANQRGNIEIRCFGGPRGIQYAEDYELGYFRLCQERNQGPWRNDGELMWLEDFRTLEAHAVRKRSPIAKALLFGFKARLHELVQEISGHLEVVGAMEFHIEYERKNVRAVAFRPNQTDAEMEALEEDAFQRQRKLVSDAVRLVEGHYFD